MAATRWERSGSGISERSTTRNATSTSGCTTMYPPDSSIVARSTSCRWARHRSDSPQGLLIEVAPQLQGGREVIGGRASGTQLADDPYVALGIRHGHTPLPEPKVGGRHIERRGCGRSGLFRDDDATCLHQLHQGELPLHDPELLVDDPFHPLSGRRRISPIGHWHARRSRRKHGIRAPRSRYVRSFRYPDRGSCDLASRRTTAHPAPRGDCARPVRRIT